MSSSRFTNQKILTPNDIGLNAVPLLAAPPYVTSNWIGTAGFDQLTLFFEWVADTGVSMQMGFQTAVPGTRPRQQPTPAPTPIGTAYNIQMQEAPQGNPPVVDLVDFNVQKDADAAITTWALNMPMNYPMFRIFEIDTVTPGTGTLTVHGALSYLG